MTPAKNEAIEDRMRKEFMGDNDDYGTEDLEQLCPTRGMSFQAIIMSLVLIYL